MKNIVAIFLFASAVLFFYSCQQPNRASGVIDSATIIDTFMYNGQIVHLDSIDKSELLKLPDSLSINQSKLGESPREIIDDTADVYRLDSVLVLKFENKDSIILVNSPEDRGTKYDYLKDIRKLNSYMTEFVTDVNLIYSIWNKRTGKETKVYSYPLFSPDGKTIICFDRFCQHSIYGFQIFSVEEDGLHLKWTRNSEFSPTPVDFRWKDDNTLFMKVYYLEHPDGLDTAVKYLRMKLPDFTK